MAAVVYSGRALRHLERVFEELTRTDPTGAFELARAIQSAVMILAEHPLIGRTREGNLRELVVSMGKSGYIALYRYRPRSSRIEVLALRHQRELDYPY